MLSSSATWIRRGWPTQTSSSRQGWPSNHHVHRKDGQNTVMPEHECCSRPGSALVVLRDYHCDGGKRPFTFGQSGRLVFQNTTQPGKANTWKKMTLTIRFSKLRSEVFVDQRVHELKHQSSFPARTDLPNFVVAMDGALETLDVLNICDSVSPESTAESTTRTSHGTIGRLRFAGPGTAQTQSWGHGKSVYAEKKSRSV